MVSGKPHGVNCVFPHSYWKIHPLVSLSCAVQEFVGCSYSVERNSSARKEWMVIDDILWESTASAWEDTSVEIHTFHVPELCGYSDWQRRVSEVLWCLTCKTVILVLAAHHCFFVKSKTSKSVLIVHFGPTSSFLRQFSDFCSISDFARGVQSENADLKFDILR